MNREIDDEACTRIYSKHLLIHESSQSIIDDRFTSVGLKPMYRVRMARIEGSGSSVNKSMCDLYHPPSSSPDALATHVKKME